MKVNFISLKRVVSFLAIVGLITVSTYTNVQAQAPPVENPQNGAVGMQGKISSPPPTQAASISVPTNGQTFTQIPITVRGICSGDLLVKLFKNNVFSGSAQCKNGSYSIIIDLFSGQNELVARVYDALDQAGPDSNTVTVTYNDAARGVGSRVTLTSNFAKRGANPGQELTWPIIMSGGSGPYAVSIDWGDGKTPDLMSQQFPGTFNIKHKYDTPGVYNIIVKATDANGGLAFLQLVGMANGALSQDNGSNNANGDAAASTTAPKMRILWEPAALLIPFILATFWLGKRYELHTLRKKIEKGDHPFK
ncbi:MAG: hypothetical protein JWL85_723 [Candidatus Saccharibacteria bacterium]|nr:hypothetical protein [Candidatus Saccharibacteria bacterium]